MKYKENEKLDIIKNKISKIPKPNILELGVQKGNSTKMFLDLCEKNDGFLTSIDIEDCSNVSNSQKWKFIQSSDDNFNYINQFIKKDLDIIFIDSLHEPNHVKKVFYNYFQFLKINGLIIIDDVSWLPFVESGVNNNDFVERINRLTFEKMLEIFNSNQENLSLEINFSGSGLAIFSKLKNILKEEIKIKNRLFSIKNLIKKLYAPKPKK
jgi:predicted O-methyltransferase YrrM